MSLYIFTSKFYLILFLFHLFSLEAFSKNTEREVLTSYEIMKTLTYSKIDERLLRNEDGTRADYRTITVGDFNNDGKSEILALALSKKYRDYVWGNNNKNFSKGNSYHQQGNELSKSGAWKSKFISINNSKSSGKEFLKQWNIKIIGESRCVHPAQILPAHLNKDAFLDFVIVCTGYDGYPYSGEHSLVMLSKGVNTFTINEFTDSKGYYHDGSTADFNNDGTLDIMLADSNTKKLYVYINEGNGKFNKNNYHFPQFSSLKTYTTEIFDINDDGFFDIFLGGYEDGGFSGSPTRILFGNKNNKFSTKQMVVIPGISGFENVLDVIKIGDYLFIVRTGSRPNFYKGALIQQISIRTLKTVSTEKNNSMDWIRRIFTLKDFNNNIYYGSLIDRTKWLDFNFKNNKVEFIYKKNFLLNLEGLYKKEKDFYIIKDSEIPFVPNYDTEVHKLTKDRLRKRAARLRIGGFLESNKTSKKYVETFIELARLRDKEITDGILLPIEKGIDGSIRPLVKHQKKINEKCGNVERYSGDTLFFVLRTNNHTRMLHQQCVYNYFKNSYNNISKDEIAFSIYRSFMHSAPSLGEYLNNYNQFKSIFANNLTSKEKGDNLKKISSSFIKDWCLPQNKYQRNIPFHRLEEGEKCPSKTSLISKETALDIFLGEYDEYLDKIISTKGICDDTFKNYKYLRELIRERKDFEC